MTKKAVKFLESTFILTDKIIHAAHPGGLCGTKMSVKACWPHIYHDLMAKSTVCIQFTSIVKSLKLQFPTKNQFNPLQGETDTDEGTQIDFAGPIQNDLGEKFYALMAIDMISRSVKASCKKNFYPSIV